MRKFQEELWLHLPPPGDLRRCLFMMSDSLKRDQFRQYMETVIEQDISIADLDVWDYFKMVGADRDFKNHLKDTLKQKEVLGYKLPLKSSIKWHKVGNILMANLYYNLEKNYQAMLEMMHHLLEVRAEIIPVTTGKAYIKAILWNGEVIESQDRISNVASYSSGIADLELMEDSKHAYQHKDVIRAIKQADYIVIAPGDLFTSIISNFVIWWVGEAIRKSKAQVIYIGNTTNKWGETQGLTYLDFVNKIERFLGRRLDVCISNNKKLVLEKEEREKFLSHQSIKWWDYLYLSEGEKIELKRRKIQYFETDLLDRVSLYKHDKKKVIRALEKYV